jgi:hypothetical protein
MDWVQTLTIIGSMIGATYAFYHITEKRIDKLEENMNKMNDYHREDMKSMDAKWERLFERLLIQDQQRGK